MKWAYGVTTCSERIDDLLPRTLESLARAGFDSPRLFADGVSPDVALALSRRWELPVTNHFPKVRAVLNWTLALWELYGRDPDADQYAIFQDDLICVRGLRDYLDANLARMRSAHPDFRTYLNLYTSQGNQTKAPRDGSKGWYKSNQMGRGALALVFDRRVVQDLLSSRSLVEKPADSVKGYKSLDGAVITALSRLGYTEMVHTPSLIQHTGDESVIGNRKTQEGGYLLSRSPSFPGEDFDATSLIR